MVRHKIPESFRALFKMVSLTAANTNRILDVSVACVKLRRRQSISRQSSDVEDLVSFRYLLRVQVQMRAIHLVESPQQILGCFVDVIPARIIGKVVGQRGSHQLLFENVHLVEKQYDACSHEPARVDDRIE